MLKSITFRSADELVRMFWFSQQLFTRNSIKLYENIEMNICEHMRHLQLTFDDYFSTRHNISLSNNWIRSPFQEDVRLASSLTLLKKQ